MVDTEEKKVLGIFKTEKYHPHDPALQKHLIDMFRYSNFFIFFCFVFNYYFMLVYLYYSQVFSPLI
jgi:hypothetical protein